MTHICVGNLTIIGSDNGLSPGRRQAITWTNVGILLIGPLGTNFSEMLIKIHTFSLKEINLKMSSGNWRPFCLGLNVLSDWGANELYRVTYICDTFLLSLNNTHFIIVHVNAIMQYYCIIASSWLVLSFSLSLQFIGIIVQMLNLHGIISMDVSRTQNSQVRSHLLLNCMYWIDVIRYIYQQYQQCVIYIDIRQCGYVYHDVLINYF